MIMLKVVRRKETTTYFDPNIDAMKKHETIASRQNYFENIGYATFLLSDVCAMVNLPVWYALLLDIDGVKSDE